MRLINIEAEVCADCVFRDKCDRQAYCWAKAMQTVDAVPVVRCRDCRKFKTYACRMLASGYDDFCSYGERKDDEHEH